jgi:hypothetical protein
MLAAEQYPFNETFDICNQSYDFDLVKAGVVNDYNCRNGFVTADFDWNPLEEEDDMDDIDHQNMDLIEDMLDAETRVAVHNLAREEQWVLDQHQDPYDNEYTIRIDDTNGYTIEYIKQSLEIFGNVCFTQSHHYMFGTYKTALIITFDGIHNNGSGDLLLNSFAHKTPIAFVIDPSHNYDIAEVTADNYHQVIIITPLY